MTIEQNGKKMIKHSQEARLFRPIHEGVMGINEKYAHTSIRMTADTVDQLDNLPIQLERRTGIHNLGGWRLVSLESKDSLDEHLMLVKGDITKPEPILVRVHSSFIMNEIFHIDASDDREQLHTAMQQIHAVGRGIIIYVNQEGAGNRLASAVAQLYLTNQGIPMIQAFEELGIEIENRSFRLATDALKMLEVTSPIALMTNNKNKRQQLEEAGFTLAPYDFHVEPASEATKKYLESKKDVGIY
jgi:3,4-dihydroxy 2-butanone 4-phosphate synthase/GTP cyclohydrolase II